MRSLEVLKGIGPQIQWLHSYVTDDRIYCVYLAPDEDTVREHARQAGVPANRVSAVRRLVDPNAMPDCPGSSAAPRSGEVRVSARRRRGESDTRRS